MRAGLHHEPWSPTMEDGLFSWSNFLKNQFTKSLGLTLGANQMWIKRNDHASKNEWTYYFYAHKWQFWNKFKFDHSLGFTSYFRLFSPWISTNLIAIEKRRRSLTLLLGLYMFCTCLWSMLWVFKHCFRKENLKVCKSSLVNESVGHRDRSIWSQERMYIFVDCWLLGLRTERELRKQTQMK